MKKLLIALLIGGSMTSTLAGAETIPYQKPADALDGGYLMATFLGEASAMTEQVYFLLSDNGKNWTALNHEDPVLVSNVGENGVRDPFILRSADQKTFYMLGTDLSINFINNWQRAETKGSQSIVVWQSNDLVNWSKPKLVKVAPDNAGCTWAPEAIWDAKKQAYLVYWSSTTADDNFAKQRVWAAYTKDFKTFDKAFVYVERDHSVTHPSIVKDGDTYYRFSKNETTKNILMETSKSLINGWSDVKTFSKANDYGFEGPAAYISTPAKDGKPANWKLLLDHYASGSGYQAFDAAAMELGDFKPAEKMVFPYGAVRHGSVIRLGEAEYQKLKLADAEHKFTVGNKPL